MDPGLNSPVKIIKMLDMEEEIAAEIEQCNDFNKKVHEALQKLEESLRGLWGGRLEGGVTSAGTGHPTLSHSKTELPKLSLGQFDGDITRWKTFWDLYMSAIHLNPELSDIEKFTYLHSLVSKTVKEAINGTITHKL